MYIKYKTRITSKYRFFFKKIYRFLQKNVNIYDFLFLKKSKYR